MAMGVVVAELGREPFLDDAVFRSSIGRHLGEHFLPDRDLVGVLAELARGGDGIFQHLLGRSHVHGGVEAGLRFGPGGPVLRRLGGRDDIFSIRPFIDEVFEKHGDFFHERQRALGKEFFVAGIEVVIVEIVRGPSGSGHPHAAGEVFRQRVVIAVGGSARWQHDPAATVVMFGVEFQVRHQRLDVADVGQHQLRRITHQGCRDGGRDVAVVGVVTGPTGHVGAAPYALQVGRQFTRGADDVVASGVELLFQPRAVDVIEGVFLHQFLGGLVVVLTAAEIEFHAVEETAVDGSMGFQQRVVVGGNRGELVLERALFGFCGVLEQADVHQEERAVGSLDRERTVGGGCGGTSGSDHAGATFERLDAAGVGSEEPCAERERIGSGTDLQVAEVFFEHLVGLFGDVAIAIELIAWFARFESEFDVDRTGFRPGEPDHRHAVLARDEHPALEGPAIIRPTDGRLAGLEIDRTRIVPHLALRLAIDREVEGRDIKIRIHEAFLPGLFELEFLGLLVFSLLDELADFRQVLGLVWRHVRLAHGHE